MRSWSDAATEKEKELGRELTSDEFSQLQDEILEQVIPESLASEGDGEDDVDLRRIVGQVVREHPDWPKEKIKDSVRRQFLEVMRA